MAQSFAAGSGPVSLGRTIPVLRSGGQGPGGLPVSAGLVDSWGRRARDLRISLIDKCNLRCQYCMPAEGLEWLPTSQLMRAEEVVRIADVGVRLLGVEEIRFTGGEPLVRADLVQILAAIHAAHPQVPLALTTNGIGLEKKAEALAEAGLTRINVSLDTICPQTFAELTRRDRLADVLRGVEAAARAGLAPLKINAVLLPGINDRQAVSLLDWALTGGYQLRFIEQMPLDADRRWKSQGTITAAQIREQLAEAYDLAPHTQPRGSTPAQLWDVYPARALSSPGQAPSPLGQVGIIASVSEPFCSTCSRTRITADGTIRSCLFSHTETDLLGALRAGASDHELATIWQAAMWDKPRAHGKNSAGFDSPDFTQPDRTMSAIGG